MSSPHKYHLYLDEIINKIECTIETEFGLRWIFKPTPGAFLDDFWTGLKSHGYLLSDFYLLPLFFQATAFIIPIPLLSGKKTLIVKDKRHDKKSKTFKNYHHDQLRISFACRDPIDPCDQIE
jgi:hypothetical protein